MHACAKSCLAGEGQFSRQCVAGAALSRAECANQFCYRRGRSVKAAIGLVQPVRGRLRLPPQQPFVEGQKFIVLKDYSAADHHGLALIRVDRASEALEAGTPLTAGGLSIRVTDPPRTADEEYLQSVATRMAVDQLSTSVLREVRCRNART